MIPQIKDYLDVNWDKFFDAKPITLQMLLISNPQGKKITHGKCTLLIFKNNEEQPSIVSKFLRTREGAVGKITQENHLLHILKESEFSPNPLDLVEINGKIVAFEQYKNGTSLKKIMQKKVNKLSISTINEIIDDISDDFEKTAALLKEFNSSLTILECTNNSYSDRAIKEVNPLYELLDLSNVHIKQINTIIENYNEKEKINKLVHFDFTPSNILRDYNSLSLIDFEFSNLSKHGFLDPYRYIFYYSYMLYEIGICNYQSYEENFYEFFKKNKKFNKIIEEFFNKTIDGDKYCEKTFFEYMILFLLSNVQLQIDETNFIDKKFIEQSSNLIKLCLNIINNVDININSYNNTGTLEQNNELTRYKSVIKEKDKQLDQNISYIAKCHQVIEEKDNQLEDNVKYIAECHQTIKEKDNQLEANLNYIANCHQEIANQNDQLHKLELELQFHKKSKVQQVQITTKNELIKIVKKIRKR